MTSLVDRIRTAGDLLNSARDEETPAGNPVTAARNYISAMEIIASAADEIPISDPGARRFFFYQLRQRMELYYERAELLLGVAEDSGLVDKPTAEGGLAAALAQRGHGAPAPSSGAVLGIPVAQSESGGYTEAVPAQYCFSEPPEPLGPPPDTSETTGELDEIFKTCSFQDPPK